MDLWMKMLAIALALTAATQLNAPRTVEDAPRAENSAPAPAAEATAEKARVMLAAGGRAVMVFGHGGWTLADRGTLDRILRDLHGPEEH